MTLKISDKLMIAFYLYVFYSFINSLYSSFILDSDIFIFIIVFSLLPPTIFLVYKEFKKSDVKLDKIVEFYDYPKTLKPEMLSSPDIKRRNDRFD